MCYSTAAAIASFFCCCCCNLNCCCYSYYRCFILILNVVVVVSAVAAITGVIVDIVIVAIAVAAINDGGYGGIVPQELFFFVPAIHETAYETYTPVPKLSELYGTQRLCLGECAYLWFLWERTISCL